MTNSEINAAFLQSTHPKVKARILDAIADHYGITSAQAFDEVTDSEAEHLLDYLTDPIRLATGVLMAKTKGVVRT
jgi:hypothetical protein